MKKVIVSIILFMTIVLSGQVAMAINGLDDIINRGDNFVNQGDPNNAILENNVKEVSDGIFAIVVVIGIVVAIVAAVVIGMQFVTASVAEKAQLKEKLIPLLVGAAIIFGAVGIWRLVVNILQGVNW